MVVLFSLPADIWREDILVFLTLKDVVKAFNAFLNHEIQKQFHTLADGLTMPPSQSMADGKFEMMKWCIEKNILPAMHVYWEYLDVQSASLLSKVCVRATFLSFGYYNPTDLPIRCTRLQYLQFYRCMVPTFDNRLYLKNLISLSFNKCPCLTTDSLIERITTCKQLKRCIVTDCELVEERGITYILDNCSRLESLELSSPLAPIYNLEVVATGCQDRKNKSLHRLKLSGCTVRSAGILQLFNCAPLVNQIHLQSLSNELKDVDIYTLTKHFTQLVDIALYNFSQLSNQSMESVARYLPYLQKLCVLGCSGISDEGVIALARSCVQLEVLNLSRCNKITDLSVSEIWQKCVSLTELRLSECIHITDAAFECRTTSILRVLKVNKTRVRSSFYAHAPNLTELDCCECLFLDNRFIQCFTTYVCKVITLELDQTHLSISDLLLLSLHLPQVESVGVSLTQANDAVIWSLVNNCSRLGWIRAIGCVGVTAATVSGIKLSRKLTIST